MLDPTSVLQDSARVAALRRYDVVDAPAERAFDDITRLATLLFDAPASAINLLEHDRQFFISEVGIGVREMPLTTSISIFTVADRQTLVVPDLAANPRFEGRFDPRFRFYAGVPLITDDGFCIGALCVLDHVPREVSSAQIGALEALARQVMTQLELRRTVAAQKEAALALQTSEERFRAAFDHVGVGMVIVDGAGRIIRANQAFENIVGRSSAELAGRDTLEFTHPEDRNANVEWVRAVDTLETIHAQFEKRYLRKDGEVVRVRVHLSPVRAVTGEVVSLVALVEDITEQRRIEDELNQTRRRLDSALIAGEVGTYEWDIQSDRIWGDRNFDRIFGVQRDSDGTAPLERFIASVHPDDRPRVQRLIETTIAERNEYEAEYRIVGDGAERRVIARGRILDDEITGLPRFTGVVLDITARKRLEEELARRTLIYDSILSTTDDFAYLFDRDGTFLFANRRLLEVWGKRLDEVVGASLFDLGYPQWHAEMHLREIAQVIAEKRPITGEVPYTAPTGIFGVYEYIFSPVLNANGEVEVIAGTTRDVTARKRAEEAQRSLTEQLRLVLDAARMGWWQYDVPAERMYWDERVRIIYDLPPEAESTTALFDRIHPDDRERVVAAFQQAIDPRSGSDYSVEFRLLFSDGRMRWISSKARTTFKGEGDARRATRMVGATVDITETKEAENAQRRLLDENQRLLASERAARGEAERASRMKDEFLATLSHELRTPLSAILGWAQILGSGMSTSEDVEEGIAVIARNARVQAQIIEDLLEMSRIVSGKVRLDVRDVDIAEVITAAIDTVRPAANAKGVRIVAKLAAGSATLRGDHARLQQVFWNLLSNAVKFTPSEGEITVRMQHTDSEVSVTVSDSGEGIRAEFLPFIFDRFRQADASTTRRHGGLGLGLAIVKQIVELHGGTVSVSSDGPDRGSTFTVLLPSFDAQQTGTTPAAARPHDAEWRDLCDGIAGLTVAVVDDEDDARTVTQRVLEHCGARVIALGSAVEALAALRDAPPDVLISDIGMPDEDGYSLIRKVRQFAPKLPAIALTAYARDAERERAESAGFDLHLAKPADPARLIAVVAELARRPS